MTNGDKIRSMTDEELAKDMYVFQSFGNTSTSSLEEILNWLKSEIVVHHWSNDVWR